MYIPLRISDEHVTIYNNLEESLLDELVRKCVHVILVLGRNKMPIKKVDINRLVFTNGTNSGARMHQAIVQKANKELSKTFGLRLYDLDDKTNPRYLLVNTKASFSQLVTRSNEDYEELTILYYILLDIFASPDEKVTEQDFAQSIKPLEISKEALKFHLDLFVKKMYLTLEKRQEVKSYTWGARAMAEVSWDLFFKHYLELMGEESDKNWPDLKKRADKLNQLLN